MKKNFFIRILCLSLFLFLLASAGTASAVDINEENFPDATFRSYVSTNFDTDSDGTLNESEILAVTSIDVNGNSIGSLEGIEYFTALTTLWCSNNQLTSLDVSKNTALTALNCYENQLTTLDVSNHTALEYLDCYDNQLTSLDVSNNTALTKLFCSSNQLTSLDVRHNTALTVLWCNSNQLTNLDVSNNTALTRLVCYSNQLTSLDVSSNIALTLLDCSPMNDASGNNVLQYLYIANDQNIPNITENRSADYIPSETEIVTNVI